MNKTFTSLALAMASVLLWAEPAPSGSVDFTQVSGTGLKNWSLNPVKLSKTPDPVKAEARVSKTPEGTPVLAFAGGDSTMVHYFFNPLIPARGPGDRVEISLQARGKGVVMLGFYNYNKHTWLQTNARYYSVNGSWTPFTATLDIPFKTRNMLTDNIRIVLGCQAKSQIELKDISWKLIVPKEKSAEIPAF